MAAFRHEAVTQVQAAISYELGSLTKKQGLSRDLA